jgi:hypothetical protein
MSERRGKQYLHPSSCGPRDGDTVLPILKTLNWQWNLFYCYIYFAIYIYHYSANTMPYTKHESENNVLTPQHTICVGRNDSNQCMRNGQYRTPTAAFAIPRCSRTPSYFKTEKDSYVQKEYY